MYFFLSLKKLKEVWQNEKQQKIDSRPDPEQPPNHRKLAEEERLLTLEKLKESKLRINNKIFIILSFYFLL